MSNTSFKITYMKRIVLRGERLFKIKSTDLTPIEGLGIVNDLKDTLQANRDRCVGMAANMIGIYKNAIVFIDNNQICSMINPKITKMSDSYETEEGCLSLEGSRKCLRYNKITVAYLNERFEEKQKTYKGFTAEIIQHEIDHLLGRVI